MTDAAFDPLQVEVYGHLFAALCEEMGAALERSAFSANIVERRDFSCALFDACGRMVAQAAHLPVHLGSAPRSVQVVLARSEREPAFALRPGDAVLLNDPFEGGTHLPDLTLVSPVFLDPGAERPDFLVATRAHHADVGGPFPGSMGPSREIHAEGLRVPPVKLVRAGEIDREVLSLLLANVRVADERRGDLLAQWAANRLGAMRVVELGREHGAEVLAARAADQLTWTARLAHALVRELPRGRAHFEDTLELAGGGEARLVADVACDGERLCFDLSATDDAVAAPLNAPRAVTEAGVFYVVRCLLPRGTPTNDGLWDAVQLITRPGSLVDARYPAAVAAGNVETSQRIVDVLLGALGALGAAGIPAASAGTMSNLSFGSPGDGAARERFAHYETHGGGAGAGPGAPGAHAVQCHMTNTRNTPIEVLERRFPVRVLAAGVRRGSGGDGRHRGGDGQRKRLRFLTPVELSWLAGRARRGPWGMAGGHPGAPGGARVRTEQAAPWSQLEPSDARTLPAGAEVEVETPGGGGFGG